MKNINEQFSSAKENLKFSRLREEILDIKEGVESNHDEDDSDKDNHEEEILHVDPEKLTDSDLKLFHVLKKVQSGEMNFNEAWKFFEMHKLSMSSHIANMPNNDPAFDFRKDSRVAFFDWMSEKLINSSGKK